jgi:hypothetical protein
MSSNDKHKNRNNKAQYSKVPTEEDSEERQGLLSDDANARTSGNVDLEANERRLEAERFARYFVYGLWGHEDPRERKNGGGDGKEPYRSGDDEDEEADKQGWSRKKIVYTAVGMIGLLVGATLTNCIASVWGVGRRPEGHSASTDSGMVKEFSGDVLRSNGTHDFKRTVVLVSIDGLRYV